VQRLGLRSTAWVGLLAILAVLAMACGPTPPPPDPDADNAGPGSPYGWFEAGRLWRGDLGDPHLVRVGSTYYAYSSPTGGRYLPVVTSTDLVNWRIHPRWTAEPAPWAGGRDPQTDPAIPAEIRYAPLNDVDTWNMNDALVAPASWGLDHDQGPWIRKDLWAPGVIQYGSTWLAFSAVRVSWSSDDPHGYGRFCITVAKATSPLGPFRDASGGTPVVCDVDPAGSIDPSPFLDPVTGTLHLLWKAAGRRSTASVPGYPSALKAARIDSNGRRISDTTTLLTTREGSWEGMTIENPSMVYWKGRYLLFYSGNDSVTNNYATGWAVCSSGPRGACSRPTSSPLLASTASEQGPGGASAVLDPNGGLRLGYAYYWPGEYRSGEAITRPRRLRVVPITQDSAGRLQVAASR